MIWWYGWWLEWWWRWVLVDAFGVRWRCIYFMTTTIGRLLCDSPKNPFNYVTAVLSVGSTHTQPSSSQCQKHSLLSRTLLPAAVWGILSKIAKKLDNQTSDLLSQRKNEIKVIVWKEIWLSNVFWHLYFFVVSSDRVFNGNNMYL